MARTKNCHDKRDDSYLLEEPILPDTVLFRKSRISHEVEQESYLLHVEIKETRKTKSQFNIVSRYYLIVLRNVQVTHTDRWSSTGWFVMYPLVCAKQWLWTNQTTLEYWFRGNFGFKSIPTGLMLAVRRYCLFAILTRSNQVWPRTFWSLCWFIILHVNVRFRGPVNTS